MPKQWWGGFVDDDPFSGHVVPLVDLKTHETESCDCNPTLVINNLGYLMMVHNSFDCRELTEISPVMEN